MKGLEDQGRAERARSSWMAIWLRSRIHGELPASGQGPEVGILRLRGHGDAVEFRNVEIKALQ